MKTLCHSREGGNPAFFKLFLLRLFDVFGLIWKELKNA